MYPVSRTVTFTSRWRDTGQFCPRTNERAWPPLFVLLLRPKVHLGSPALGSVLSGLKNQSRHHKGLSTQQAPGKRRPSTVVTTSLSLKPRPNLPPSSSPASDFGIHLARSPRSASPATGCATLPAGRSPDVGGAAAGGRTPQLQTPQGSPESPPEAYWLRLRTPDPGRRHSRAAIRPAPIPGRSSWPRLRTASPHPTPARFASPAPSPRFFRVGEGARLGESRWWRPPACGELADSLLVSQSPSCLLQTHWPAPGAWGSTAARTREEGRSRGGSGAAQVQGWGRGRSAGRMWQAPTPHRLPPEDARSAGDPGAPPGHRPRPAASTRSRPSSGAARRHHAGHPEDPPAADLQDRHRPRRDGASGWDRGAQAGRGRPRAGRGEREWPAGPGRWAARWFCALGRGLSPEQGPAARQSGESPQHTRECRGSLGLGPRALDKACWLWTGPRVPAPAAWGPPEPSEFAAGFVVGVRGSSQRTEAEAWWQMAWSTRPRGTGGLGLGISR